MGQPCSIGKPGKMNEEMSKTNDEVVVPPLEKSSQDENLMDYIEERKSRESSKERKKTRESSKERKKTRESRRTSRTLERSGENSTSNVRAKKNHTSISFDVRYQRNQRGRTIYHSKRQIPPKSHSSSEYTVLKLGQRENSKADGVKRTKSQTVSRHRYARKNFRNTRFQTNHGEQAKNRSRYIQEEKQTEKSDEMNNMLDVRMKNEAVEECCQNEGIGECKVENQNERGGDERERGRNRQRNDVPRFRRNKSRSRSRNFTTNRHHRPTSHSPDSIQRKYKRCAQRKTFGKHESRYAAHCSSQATYYRRSGRNCMEGYNADNSKKTGPVGQSPLPPPHDLQFHYHATDGRTFSPTSSYDQLRSPWNKSFDYTGCDELVDMYENHYSPKTPPYDPKYENNSKTEPAEFKVDLHTSNSANGSYRPIRRNRSESVIKYKSLESTHDPNSKIRQRMRSVSFRSKSTGRKYQRPTFRRQKTSYQRVHKKNNDQRDQVHYRLPNFERKSQNQAKSLRVAPRFREERHTPFSPLHTPVNSSCLENDNIKIGVTCSVEKGNHTTDISHAVECEERITNSLSPWESESPKSVRDASSSRETDTGTSSNARFLKFKNLLNSPPVSKNLDLKNGILSTNKQKNHSDGLDIPYSLGNENHADIPKVLENRKYANRNPSPPWRRVNRKPRIPNPVENRNNTRSFPTFSPSPDEHAIDMEYTPRFVKYVNPEKRMTTHLEHHNQTSDVSNHGSLACISDNQNPLEHNNSTLDIQCSSRYVNQPRGISSEVFANHGIRTPSTIESVNSQERVSFDKKSMNHDRPSIPADVTTHTNHSIHNTFSGQYEIDTVDSVSSTDSESFRIGYQNSEQEERPTTFTLAAMQSDNHRALTLASTETGSRAVAIASAEASSSSIIRSSLVGENQSAIYQPSLPVDNQTGVTQPIGDTTPGEEINLPFRFVSVDCTPTKNSLPVKIMNPNDPRLSAKILKAAATIANSQDEGNYVKSRALEAARIMIWKIEAETKGRPMIFIHLDSPSSSDSGNMNFPHLAPRSPSDSGEMDFLHSAPYHHSHSPYDSGDRNFSHVVPRSPSNSADGPIHESENELTLTRPSMGARLLHDVLTGTNLDSSIYNEINESEQVHTSMFVMQNTRRASRPDRHEELQNHCTSRHHSQADPPAIIEHQHGPLMNGRELYGEVAEEHSTQSTSWTASCQLYRRDTYEQHTRRVNSNNTVSNLVSPPNVVATVGTEGLLSNQRPNFGRTQTENQMCAPASEENRPITNMEFSPSDCGQSLTEEEIEHDTENIVEGLRKTLAIIPLTSTMIRPFLDLHKEEEELAKLAGTFNYMDPNLLSVKLMKAAEKDINNGTQSNVEALLREFAVVEQWDPVPETFVEMKKNPYLPDEEYKMKEDTVEENGFHRI